MENITALFQQVYLPKQAIVIFEHATDESEYYVESYDMDNKGCPINAHPLSVEEAKGLAKALDAGKERYKAFLKPKGLMPEKVLYLNPSESGFVIWHTPPQQKQLFFSVSLGIPNGIANIPHLLWVAGKEELYLFALKGREKPTLDIPLFHAPFFNLYEDGKVCMGTVDVDIDTETSLEDFMASWEQYFFNSYFSHLISGHNPINGNIIQLWQGLMNTKTAFPAKALVKTSLTLKTLLTWNF
jgi:PRTRC genetic system protein B